MRIRPPELETSICDAKYHVSLIDGGRLFPIVDLIDDLPPPTVRCAGFLVKLVGARRLDARKKPAFALNRNQQQPSDVAFFFTHQNDAASTNQNEAAALQQLITDSFRNNQQLVTKRYTPNAAFQLIKTTSPHYQQLVTQTNGWSLD
ncbi:hypothetical protein F511_38229 [Dorcoceras hygrometricum]|uniref:Uncharacterized protein n=1 Tax=Dorcoceras hygrometricum TaxID=472368 RepID=A0A2Z7C6A0_9LAMI|nr:hypothetical protein F511_38229 [Dorcoceras hygrometricum]